MALVYSIHWCCLWTEFGYSQVLAEEHNSPWAPSGSSDQGSAVTSQELLPTISQGRGHGDGWCWPERVCEQEMPSCQFLGWTGPSRDEECLGSLLISRSVFREALWGGGQSPGLETRSCGLYFQLCRMIHSLRASLSSSVKWEVGPGQSGILGVGPGISIFSLSPVTLRHSYDKTTEPGSLSVLAGC